MPLDNRRAISCESGVTAAQRRKIEAISPKDFELYEWQIAQT